MSLCNCQCTLNSLSEQQLADCSRAQGNEGCDGGLMDDACGYIIKEGGSCSYEEFPYTDEDGICKASSCGTKYNEIKAYTDVTCDDSTALKYAVAEGCVYVPGAFQFYSGGVLTSSCDTSLEHGVLAVGYGTDGDQEYCKVKMHGNYMLLFFCFQLSLLLIVDAASMVQ